MTKDAIGDWSVTANDNSDIGGINIAEGCGPGNLNDAVRTMMGQLAAFHASLGDGATGAIGTDIQAQDALLQAIADGSVTAAEFGHLSGVTSAIQTQLNGKAATGDIPSIAGLATETYVDNEITTATSGLGWGYDSGLVTLSTGSGAQVFAHSLASTPTERTAYIQCTSADSGYSVGDRVVLQGSPASGANYGFKMDATNVTLLKEGALPVVSGSSGYNTTTIDETKWQIRVRA